MEQLPKHPKAAKLFSALLQALDISANKLAKEISTPEEDYSQQVISNYALGRNKPSQEVLAAIARRYKSVNMVFLLTGEGEPFPNGRYNEKPAPTPAPAPVVAVAEPLPDYTSAAGTIDAAYVSVLKEQVADLKEDKATLRDDLAAEKAETKRLRELLASLGKSPDSPDAAGSPTPTPTAPVCGFLTDARRRELAERFNEVIEEEMAEAQGVQVSR